MDESYKFVKYVKDAPQTLRAVCNSLQVLPNQSTTSR